MDFTLNNVQKEYRQNIIDFVQNQLNESDDSEIFVPKQWNKISEFGLLGITVDEKYGGLNENYQTAAVAFEALGYACQNNGLVFAVNNHIWVSQNLIYLYGSDKLKEKYLKTMVEGKKIGAIAITEADAGSDALGMNMHAFSDGDEYILNGTKMFISNGPIADIFIVFAVTDTEPIKKITAFVVEKEYIGVEIGNNIEKMGLHACPTSEIIFKQVRVPKENILGSVNAGSGILMSAIEWERFFEFVPHIGAMRRVKEKCVEHAKSRKQFGKSIQEYQAVSHKIADMELNIEMAELMMHKIAWLKDNKKNAYKETAMFKLFVSEGYIKACRDAVQIFGAYGYTKEYGLERELRDALASSIYSGTNEMQKNTIFKYA